MKPDENKQEEEVKPKPSQSEDDDGAGVTIPEDFQKEVHGVMKKATTKHHLSHIRDRVNMAEDDMRKKEAAKAPKTMSMEGSGIEL